MIHHRISHFDHSTETDSPRYFQANAELGWPWDTEIKEIKTKLLL